AYEEQCAAIEKLGGRIVLMASRALVKAARSPDDYAKVYGRILAQVKEPVIIHWLGELFDPALEGYWGHKDHYKAMDVAIDMIAAHPEKVDGVKVSLLDKDKEIAMRRRLPQGVRMFTGDDFNYAELIAGDAQHYSDALLGIFDAIAPAASAALGALTRGEVKAFHDILAPTVPLSRHMFKARSLERLLEGCARVGISAISPWRDIVQACGVERAAKLIRDHGMTVSGLCRGGMFPAADEAGRRAALDDNRRAIDEAAAIGAQCLVLVVGGLPKNLRDIAGARMQVREALHALLPYARQARVPLGIE